MSLNPSNAISKKMTGHDPFRNVAGLGKTMPQEVDAVLVDELKVAGIEWFEADSRYGEPKSMTMGALRGWLFRRAWYYWIATGPGLPLDAATRLHEEHGKSVRVDGHCGCPSPTGAVELYHVDNAAGLRALADAIKNHAE